MQKIKNTTFKLLKSKEVAEQLSLSVRSVQHKGKIWEITARMAGDPALSSSPQNGLRRAQLCERRHRYHPRDIAEYIENATREILDQPLVSWRKEECHD